MPEEVVNTQEADEARAVMEGAGFDVDEVSGVDDDAGLGDQQPEVATAPKRVAAEPQLADESPAEEAPRTPAQEAYDVRVARRRLQEEREQVGAVRQTLEQMAAQWAAMQQAAQQQPQSEAQEEEPEFNVDPEVQALLRHQADRLAEQFRGTMEPILTRQQQEDQFAQQQRAWQEQRSRVVEALSAVARAEEEYAASPDGAGYNDRLKAFQERTAAAYSPLVEYGVPQEAIQEIQRVSDLGLAQYARYMEQQYGVPVPVFMDTVFRGFLGPGASQAQVDQAVQNATGQAPAAAPKKAPAKPSQAVAMAKKATQDGTARAPRSAGPSVDEITPEYLLENGGKIPAELMERLSKTGKLDSWMANMADRVAALSE